MPFPSYKSMKQSESSSEIIIFIGSIVISLLILAGLAETNLYVVKTLEGTRHQLSLWNGKSCNIEGCLSQTLPPAEWCGERRSLYIAMQVISVISLVGSLFLLASSVLSVVAVKTRCVDILWSVSAFLTWLILMLDWSIMAGIFHSKACSNPSFSEINYQYGVSFSLFLMSWLFLTVMIIYSVIVRSCD
ncbi:uncharacterized protein TM35_000063160 [Trypanosoma theileri]|uniref:Amastin n=1 Tax=Trypanosoma theileri TaxID=67003 RepID=A0A1X0P379_9TRYP|nr:uncharacterized protein TM35_000063160 [Trypanosoma theileri]ORC91311.1 hypothetical protein TM35_000063160 [Trypanosoma theileri]